MLSPMGYLEPQWETCMNELTADSLASYCVVVHLDPLFLPYFCSRTPKQELGKLPLGLCPIKCKVDGGVESLCAIP